MSEEIDTSNIHWPRLSEVPCPLLASQVAEICLELNARQYQHREDQIVAAKELWPALYKSIRAKGKELGLNNLCEPVMPEWATEPVVPLKGWYGKKPKNKAEVMEIAIRFGDGNWAKLGELWLWISNTGPIITRTLQKYGYIESTNRK